LQLETFKAGSITSKIKTECSVTWCYKYKRHEKLDVATMVMEQQQAEK
jgi:hypothetical protein